MKPEKNQCGFTLVEVMVAIFVLTVGILSLHLMQVAAMKANASANRIRFKTTFTSDRLERQIALSYSDTQFSDIDNDGTGKDSDKNGLDGSGNNFGLDDTQCCQNGRDPSGNTVAGCTRKADYCQVQNGYFLYWNVAVGIPVGCAKTIKVSVRSINVEPGKFVNAEYVKTDPMASTCE